MKTSDDYLLDRIVLPEHVRGLIQSAKSFRIIGNRPELLEIAAGNTTNKTFEVRYDVNGKMVCEAVVTRCKNGFAVNYPDPYMRRRDPDCMLIGDEKPSDKTKYEEKYEEKFSNMREIGRASCRERV